MKRKVYLFLVLLLASMGVAQAQDLQLHRIGEENITKPESGRYYVLEGHNQLNGTTYLLDNNGSLKGTDASIPILGADGLKYVWIVTGDDTDGYSLQNLKTGKYIDITGTTNRGGVSLSESAATVIWEVSDDEKYVGLKNSSGQYIDVSYRGTDPTSWSGGVDGSRRLYVHEADLTIGDSECYTLQLKDSDPALYVTMGAEGANATYSTNGTPLYIKFTGTGWTLNEKSDNSGLFLSAVEYWHAKAMTTGTEWKIAQTDDGGFTFYQSVINSRGYLGHDSATEGAELLSNKAATSYVLTAVSDLQITYNYIYEGQRIGSSEHSVKYNDPYPNFDFSKTGMFADLEGLCTTTGIPTGNVTSNGEYDITLDINIPFVPTTLENGEFAADTKYYYMTLRNKFVYYNATSTKFLVSDEIDKTDSYLFAYTGNTQTGYHIYNKALGTGSVAFENDPQNSGAIVQANSDPAGTWIVGKNKGGFYLREIVDGITDAYANERNGGLSFWRSSTYAPADDGSRIRFYDADCDWDVTFEGNERIYVTGLAATITPVTSEEDNSHWYVIMQSKGGYSLVYDDGVNNNIKRAGTAAIATSLNGEPLSGNEKYLVRFIKDANGMVRVQFATGNFLKGVTTKDSYFNAGTYMVYNIDNKDGHFGWNISTDGGYGDRIDNNGPGANVVVYGSGQITTIDGNNDWSIYETSITRAGVYTIECERASNRFGILTTTSGNPSSAYYANKSELNQPRQQTTNQWAIIYTPTGNMYVYNVGEKKYLNCVDGQFTLTDLPVSTNAHLMAAMGDNRAKYPYVLAFGDSQLNMTNENSITVWNNLYDPGNMVRLVPVGTVEDDVYIKTLGCDLITQLRALKENPDNKTYFVLTDAAKTQLENAIATIRPDESADYTQAQIDALLTLLTEYQTNQLLYNMPISGRYFVRNYRYLTSNGEQQHPYMANHYNLMGLGEALLSYYCVWDVTRTGDGTAESPYVYTMQNEGQRFLAKPRELGTTDDAFLGYQNCELRTHFGCFTDAETPEPHLLQLVPAKFGYIGYGAIQTSQAVNGNQYAAYFDDNTKVGAGNLDETYNTHDIMAGTLDGAADIGTDAAKQVFLWDFIPVTGKAEAALFENQINTALVGYAGGVVSISTAAAVEDKKDTESGSDWLERVIEEVNSATSNLSNNQGCAEPQTSDATVGGIGNMQKVFKTVLNNRNGVDGRKSKLHIELQVGEHFYFESLRGDRPATHSRLTGDTDKNMFVTVSQDNITSEDMYKYMWYIEEATDDYFKAYTLDTDGNKLYFKRYPNSEDTEIVEFKLEEVTPGMYVILDKNPTNAGNPFLTIGGENYEIEPFDKIEISSLWKLKTVTAKEVTLKADPEDKADYYAKLFSSDGNQVEEYVTKYTNAGKYADGSYLDIYGNPITSESVAGNRCYATYCPAIDMMIPEGANYKAYYVSGVVTNAATSETALGNCSVILKSVPLTQNKQFLKGGSGYILISQEFDTEQSSLVEKIDYSELDPKDVTAPEGNLLTGALVDVVSQNTDSSQPDYFKSFVALGYAATGKALGTNNSIPVYGEGLGFYNVKVGSKVDAGKSYMKLTDLEVSFHDLGNGGHVTVDAESASKQVAAMRFVIQEDESNEETGIVPADTRPTDVRIYDISGRRVSKAGKGIYIVNGKKVIY